MRGLMVLLALLRLVPALRLALMLAYKPGLFDFISRIVTRLSLFVQNTRQCCRFGKQRSEGVGGGTKGVPLPLLSFATYVYIYIRV